MTRIRLYQILDVEKFVELFTKSCNKIWWHLPNHTVRELTEDPFAVCAIKEEAERGKHVELSFAESQDYFRFVNFMIHGCC